MKYLFFFLLFPFPGFIALHADRSEIGNPRLMQGPMLGAVSENSIRVWARFSGEYRVRLEFATDRDFRRIVGRVEGDSRAEEDFILEFKVTRLAPDTRYFYRFFLDDREPKYLKNEPPPHFRTAPPSGQPVAFRVGLGSCARFQEDPLQPIWHQVHRQKPDLFFWLGDNIYGDALFPRILREEYRRQRDVAAFRPVMMEIPQLATWDDHDFGLNDHDRENPVKDAALQVHRDYWANGAYGLPDLPGVFFHYAYGGVDFFFLDGRTYRDPFFQPDSPKKTLLGKGQLQWLKDGLARSRAPFKVLICGSGWTSLKGPEGDSWATALSERDALFDWITRSKIHGVVLVSGDVHRSELNIIPWSERGGYDFYEFVSSPLAQNTSTDLRPDIWEVAYARPVTGVASFGMLEFDLTAEDPELRYRVVDSLGQQHYQDFTVRASELKNGVSSWQDKASPTEIARHEAFLKRSQKSQSVPRP